MTDQAAKEVKKASCEVEVKQRSIDQAHDDAQAVTKMKKKVSTALKRKRAAKTEPPSTLTFHPCLNMKYADFKALKGTE